MPGGDGTGPSGYGPMTGRAAGYCAGYSVPGYMNPIPGRGFGGRGRGRGFGRGRGRGWGWSVPYGGYPYADPSAYSYPYASPSPYAPEISPKEEASMLREQAKAMQGEIKAINDRITELESIAKKTK